MNKKMLFLSALIITSMSAFAADQTMQMGDHGSLSPASQELVTDMMSMHDDMMAGGMSSDPDVAFAKGMIAHHQGAIKMSQTQLKFGKDPEMRKLAEDIIKAQQPEIDQMQKWLKTHQNQ